MDRRIDPKTRDYVSDGHGGVQPTNTSASSLYHAIATQRGTVATDLGAGSRLAELGIRTLDTAPLAEHIVRLALQPLVQAGRVSDPQVVAELDDRGRLLIHVRIHDQTGDSEEVDLDV